MNVDLSLNEIDAVLLLFQPRQHQQLGYADKAKKKLQKARSEMLLSFDQDVTSEEEAETPRLF